MIREFVLYWIAQLVLNLIATLVWIIVKIFDVDDPFNFLVGNVFLSMLFSLFVSIHTSATFVLVKKIFHRLIWFLLSISVLFVLESAFWFLIVSWSLPEFGVLDLFGYIVILGIRYGIVPAMIIEALISGLVDFSADVSFNYDFAFLSVILLICFVSMTTYLLLIEMVKLLIQRWISRFFNKPESWI